MERNIMDTSNKNDNLDLLSLTQKLENRISKIESFLKINPIEGELSNITDETTETKLVKETDEEREEKLELKIGQSWLAFIGTTVMIIGLCFLLSLSYESLPAYLPSLIGYVLTAMLFVLSQRVDRSYENIAGYLLSGSMILLFYSTLRFHFFGITAAIQSNSTEVILLCLIAITNMVIALWKKSIYLAGLSLTMALITAVVSNESFFLYSVATLVVLFGSYLRLQFNWVGLIMYLMPITYFTHLLWYFIHNTATGNDLTPISIPFNLLFVLVYAFIYSISYLKREEPRPENLNSGLFTFFNSVLAFLSILLILLSSKYGTPSLVYFFISIFFIAMAIIFWIKEHSRYSTFFYAMLGYLSLSLAIIYWGVGDYLIWLCWQSFLVVVTSVWFRSKYIVVANFIIYLFVLIAYLTSSLLINYASLSFGVVALLSARILNWQKDKLELQTEQMRNAYLAAALFTIPYSLYHTVPEGLISISWIIVAVVYYLLSILLNNKKYRWMSFITFLLTLIYIAIIGFTSSDLIYKTVSFLALGIVLLVVSIYYAKRKVKTTQTN